jgi:hypothetical protein
MSTARTSTGRTRLAILGGTLVTALALGLAVVSGGGAAAMRATSEVVGSYGAQQVSFSASAISLLLTGGAKSTAVLSTVPNAHVAWVVNISGAKAAIKGTAKADAKGTVTITFTVPAAASSASPVKGTLTVHVTDPGKQGTATITFQALPLLQFAASTKVKPSSAGPALTVTVKLAQPATVAVTVTLQGAKKPALVSGSTKGDAKHPVVVFGTFGSLKGHVQATVSVKVTGGKAQSDTLTFPVTLQ